MYKSPTRTTLGMTLLEVMVALVIVSAAILGLSRSGAWALETQYALESRTLGLIVAENVISELRLQGNISPGRADGTTQMAERAWRYQVVVQPTTEQSMLRVDVGVYESDNGDELIVMHTGFVSS